MLVTIKKNSDQTWNIFPNTGPFKGLCVATAEGIELTSVTATTGQVVGALKAVWGIQLAQDLDVYSDTETLRSLCLGKPFSGAAEHPVNWLAEGVFDLDTKRILRHCHRLIMLGSTLLRR